MKRVSSQGGKPVILWLLARAESFIGSLSFALLAFFFLQITTPFTPPGPSCTKVFYIMGPVSLAFL